MHEHTALPLHMDPQTPPARRVGPIYTPSTPRYGPLEDQHFLDTRKKLFSEEQPAVLLTPRTTPRKRVLAPPKTPQRGSGRQGKRLAKLTKIDEGVYSSQLAAPHPHQPAAKMQGKGMWYVFRGKKVWRPFKGDEKMMKPVKLFQVDSDDETDIEI